MIQMKRVKEMLMKWLEDYLVLFFILCITLTEAEQPHMFRRLHKTGFHRELYTSIKWTVKPHHLNDVHHCGMLLVETLPSGVYVDPFQLNSLLQFGGSKVLVDGKVDIEKPEHLSPELVLHMYTDLKVVQQSRQGAILSGSVTVPIHLRYHEPSDNPEVSYVDVEIHNPRFYINCTIKESVGLLQAPCDHTNSSQCLWLKYDFYADKESVVCSIPVGNLSHLHLVVMVTLLFTCGGCLFIIYITLTKQKWIKLKES